jgi:tryptophan synthase alpha chain
MNRIKNKFDQLKNSNKKALGIFLTAGDPDFETSQNIIEKLPDKGVDFIEIGMPFSDPMADGPSIQLSSQRALKIRYEHKKMFYACRKF